MLRLRKGMIKIVLGKIPALLRRLQNSLNLYKRSSSKLES